MALTGGIGVTQAQKGFTHARTGLTRAQEGLSLLLNWKPNGLHVPYYAAKAKGYYESEGVRVTDIQSGQGSDFSAKQVGLGNVPLGITSADQLLNVNTRGLAPQSVGVVMQQSPVVVFTTEETFGGDLNRVSDLAGKTVGTGPGMVRILTKLLLERKGVLEDVTIVDTGFDTVQQLLGRQIDAAGGVFADAVVAREEGRNVSQVRVAETIPSYGHVVATNREFADQRPDAVRGFLRATARGAAWATQNPDTATDLLVDANPAIEETAEVQQAKWTEMATNYLLSSAVRQHGWGWSEATPWETMYDALADADLLGGEVAPDSVWTNDFLDTDSRYVGDYSSMVGIQDETTTSETDTETTTSKTDTETTTTDY